MIFKGYHHVGLISDDADRSLKFYTEGLGGEIKSSFKMGDSGRTIYLVDLGGNAVVEIIPRGNGDAESNARWAHIALATDDVQAAHDLAIAAGATLRNAPNGHNSFVFGPDGEVIEFFLA